MSGIKLNLNEAENVVGGRGGSPTYLPTKEYCDVYQICRGDTLTKIAKTHHTTVDYLMSINNTIKNKNDITTGYYIYVPNNSTSHKH